MTGYVTVSAHIAGKPIVDPNTGAPTSEHIRQLNDNLRNFRVAISQLAQQADDLEASLVAAGIALTTAEAVRAELDAKIENDDLINSYTDPVSVLTAVDAGDGTATITVANHNRVYGDGTSVAVTGTSLTGASLSTLYYVVYYDEFRTGGAVTYTLTTNPALAGQSNHQHLIGDITTPSSGGGGTGGGGVAPPRVRQGPNEYLE